MISKLISLALLSLLLCAWSLAAAGFHPKRDKEINWNAFLSPNERWPSEQLPILSETIEGVQVSAGTERGWITASLNPDARYVFLADADPEVVLYNRINLLLIDISKSPEDLIRLKTRATRDEWKEAMKRIQLSKEEQKFLKDKKTWKWWSHVHEASTHNEQALGRADLYSSLNQTDPHSPFYETNYHYVQDQYWRLKRLVALGRVRIQRCDFSSPKDIKTLIKEIKKTGWELSLIDISNAWEDRYIGHQATEALYRALTPVSRKKTILMISSPARDVVPVEWSYFGYTFEHLGKKDFRFLFHESVPVSSLDGIVPDGMFGKGCNLALEGKQRAVRSPVQE